MQTVLLFRAVRGMFARPPSGGIRNVARSTGRLPADMPDGIERGRGVIDLYYRRVFDNTVLPPVIGCPGIGNRKRAHSLGKCGPLGKEDFRLWTIKLNCYIGFFQLFFKQYCNK